MTGRLTRLLPPPTLMLYYVLAVSSVIALTAGLYLTYRVTEGFRDSVQTSERWMQRLERYAELGNLAAAVNAPGNDVFEHADVPAQQLRLQRAADAFATGLAAVRADLATGMAGEARQILRPDVERIDAANRAMVADTQEIFEHLRREEPQLAARRMAFMDRRYADLTMALAGLRVDALHILNGQLKRDQRAAAAFRRYHLPLAAAVLFMIGGGVLYGHKASTSVDTETRARNGYIAQLQESERTLESRVADRTADIRVSERRMADAQQLAHIGSWEWDLTTHAVTWSDETYRLYALEPGDVVPSYDTYMSFVHPDDRDLVAGKIQHTLQTTEPFAYDHRIIRADGSPGIVAVTGRLRFDEGGRPTLMGGASQDVTEQRTAECARRGATELLRKSEERFQFASRATNDALWDWDFTTNAIWWNEGFGRMFGHVDSEPTLDFRARLIHPDDAEHVCHSLHQFLESTREVWTVEYRFKCHGGAYAWVLDRGLVVRNPDGSPRRMIGSMMNITERKESERMKSDFVSFVSHQLRTPLSGMTWMLELAAETPDLPPIAREHIADARESAGRLVTLINDLLDIARLESGRTGAVPAAVQLDDLTRSVLREFQGLVIEKRHEVVLQAGSVAPVWADPQMTRQVIVNLLSNAIKYTPQGGRINITVEQQNASVQWKVRDTGVGVPHFAQSRLFEKFYRADNVQTLEAEGTGLGLYLVRLIVQQAGGRVWCESIEGQGALFAFVLPVVSPEGGVG